jgi:C-terminal processing protease CtpA/Prc
VRIGWALLFLALVACGPGMGSIGAMLTKNHTDGKVIVRQVPRDMEAAQAGLEPGDEILFIDGRDARAMTADEVHQELVGPVGTTLRLTILRGETVLRLTVRRGALK